MYFSFTCQVSMSVGTPIFVLVCESGPSPIQFTWYVGACLDNTLLVYLWSVNEYSSNSWNSVACIITWKDLSRGAERNISEREIKDASAHIFYFLLITVVLIFSFPIVGLLLPLHEIFSFWQVPLQSNNLAINLSAFISVHISNGIIAFLSLMITMLSCCFSLSRLLVKQ